MLNLHFILMLSYLGEKQKMFVRPKKEKSKKINKNYNKETQTVFQRKINIPKRLNSKTITQTHKEKKQKRKMSKYFSLILYMLETKAV